MWCALLDRDSVQGNLTLLRPCLQVPEESASWIIVYWVCKGEIDFSTLFYYRSELINGEGWIWTSLQACMITPFSRVQLFATLWTVARQASLSRDSSGKNTGVGCHALLQGIFLTQGSNPGLLHCRQILYCWATGEPPKSVYSSPNSSSFSF